MSESLYSQYTKERTNDIILETGAGFATYTYLDAQTVYIKDIFIVSECRGLGMASQLADQIVLEAKSKGCTTLLGSVCVSAKNSTDSLKVLLAYGMKLKSTVQDGIYLTKDI